MNKKIPDYAGEFLKPDRKLNRIGKPQTFGDFVREQLKNPNSELSLRVNYFRKHMIAVKHFPECLGFKWFRSFPIYKKFYDTVFPKDYFYIDIYPPSSNKNTISDFRS